MSISPVPSTVLPVSLPSSTAPSSAGEVESARAVTAPSSAPSLGQEGMQQDEELSRQQAVAALNEHLRAWSTNLRFNFDKDAERVVIQVVDTKSGDVVRQIPSEEALHVAHMLGKLPGALFSAQA